jgi:hypothetical protein
LKARSTTTPPLYGALDYEVYEFVKHLSGVAVKTIAPNIGTMSSV